MGGSSMSNIEALWDPNEDTDKPAGATDDTLASFEVAHGVKLPALLVAMYRARNGGPLRDVVDPDVLLAFLEDGDPRERISSLEAWIEDNPFLADEADELEEALGDLNRIIPIADDGAVAYALDYVAPGADGEPRIVCIDFEFNEAEAVAPSFEAWIDDLTRTDAACAVDWAEHESYERLHREVLTVDDEEIEQVLCDGGGGALLLFSRTKKSDAVTGVERVSLPKGVDADRLEIERFRPRPGPTYTLHLEPMLHKNIAWETSELRSNGEWRNDKSEGAPVYCTLEASTRKVLKQVERQLREGGFVHEDTHEPDEGEAAVLGGLKKAFDGLTAALLAPSPELPSTPPEPGGDPSAMKPEDVLEELKGLSLYHTAQLQHVRSVEDARALIERARAHRERSIALAGRLRMADDPLNALGGLGSEAIAGARAMDEVKGRSPEAHELLKAYDQDLAMECARPSEAGPETDALFDDILSASTGLTRQLQGLMAGNGNGSEEGLREAVAEYCRHQDRYGELGRAGRIPEITWIQMKLCKTDEFVALQVAWDELRTEHRKLYKAKRSLFERIDDTLPL